MSYKIIAAVIRLLLPSRDKSCILVRVCGAGVRALILGLGRESMILVLSRLETHAGINDSRPDEHISDQGDYP